MDEWLGVIERLPHKHLTWGDDNVRLGRGEHVFFAN